MTWQDDEDMPENAYIFSTNAEQWGRLGRAVAERRALLGLSQTEAAKISGVSLSFWSHFEGGKKNKIRRMNVNKAEKALQWKAGSIERFVFHDIEPSALQEDEVPTSSDNADVVALRIEIVSLEKRLDRNEKTLNELLQLLRGVPKPRS
jgi:transcriptional regulator with XRE-family HTH domain